MVKAMRDYFSDLIPTVLPTPGRPPQRRPSETHEDVGGLTVPVPNVPRRSQQRGTGQNPHEQRLVPGAPNVPSNKNDDRNERGNTLEQTLVTACQEHGLDAGAMREKLQAAGDWNDPSLTVEAVRTYVRCVAQEQSNLDALPLADKLRCYGRPWPLEVDGRVVCCLVADEEAKRACEASEPCYTASEVDALVQAAPDEMRALHALRERFSGTIRKLQP